ncbi:MAG: ComEC/Rec2 family competence protein [Anaerolineales bacterium]|nr:ComEC/Rec2 family competence protein [Anaerolineales bacterium]
MSLFFFSLSFLLGIAAGRPLIATGLLGCAASPHFWLTPLCLLPLAALLRWRLRRNIPIPPMQWPISAGFEPPIRTPPWPLLLCLVLGFAAGILRYAAAPFDRCWTPADLAYYNLPASQRYNRSAPSSVVIGWINNYPTPGEGFQTLIVAAKTVQIGEACHPASGQVHAIVESGEHYWYGQPVQVTGRMFDRASSQGIALDNALARRNIFSVFTYPEVELLPGPVQGNPLLRMIYAVRDRGVAAINRALPEPYAALANGMIFGVESGIPRALQEQFNATGASHVIVISGANVALITGVLMGLAVRLLGARRALWPTLAGIATYAVLVGGDAAVIRASIMGGLVVIAATLNRRSMALVSLGVACSAMIMANPLALWDIGLQLSSMATAGLAILQPVYGRVAGRFLQRMGLAPTHTLSTTGGARRWITPFPSPSSGRSLRMGWR